MPTLTSYLHLQKYLTDVLHEHVFTDNSRHVTIYMSRVTIKKENSDLVVNCKMQ